MPYRDNIKPTVVIDAGYKGSGKTYFHCVDAVCSQSLVNHTKLKFYYVFNFFLLAFFSSCFYSIVELNPENRLMDKEQIIKQVIETEYTRAKGSRKEVSQELLTEILTT